MVEGCYRWNPAVCQAGSWRGGSLSNSKDLRSPPADFPIYSPTRPTGLAVPDDQSPTALVSKIVKVIIKHRHFYRASYNTRKDRWHITSNGDDSNNDNDNDNQDDNDNNKNTDKLIVIIVV